MLLRVTGKGNGYWKRLGFLCPSLSEVRMILFTDVKPEVLCDFLEDSRWRFESKLSAVPCLPVPALLPVTDHLHGEADKGTDPDEHQPGKKVLSKPCGLNLLRGTSSLPHSDFFFMLNSRMPTGEFLSSNCGTHRIHSPGSNWSCLDTQVLGKQPLSSLSNAAWYEAFSEDEGLGSHPQTQPDSPHLLCHPNLQVWLWSCNVWIRRHFLLVCVAPKEELSAVLQKTGHTNCLRNQSKNWGGFWLLCTQACTYTKSKEKQAVRRMQK